eukprot:5512215-Pyramimonas_sp.AAC.1
MGGGKENFKASVEAPLSVTLNPLAWALWGLDFTSWAAGASGPALQTSGPGYLKMSQLVKGTTATRRRTGYVEKLQETPFEGVSSGYGLVKRSYGTYVHRSFRARVPEAYSPEKIVRFISGELEQFMADSSVRNRYCYVRISEGPCFLGIFRFIAERFPKRGSRTKRVLSSRTDEVVHRT